MPSKKKLSRYRHRYDDGCYHRMIGNAKQDEQLFHHQRDCCNTGVQDASYGKNLKQDLVLCMQTDNGSGAFLYRVYGGRPDGFNSVPSFQRS